MWYEVCTFEQVAETVAKRGIAAAVPLYVYPPLASPKLALTLLSILSYRAAEKPDKIISVQIKTLTGKMDQMSIPRNATIEELKEKYQEISGNNMR